MKLKPYPRDSNGKPMEGCGTEPFTERITIGTDPVDLRFGVDMKGVNIYNEGPDDLTITGLDTNGNEIAAGVVDLTDDAIVDNGDGTLNATTLIDHGFAVGSNVTIQDRSGDSLVGVYAVKAGSATDQLVLDTSYVVNLTTAESVDNGDGTVSLFTDGDHHLAVAGYCTIADRTDAAYAGSYTIAAGTADDELIITVAAVDESAGVTVGGTVTGVYDESGGVAEPGDVTGVHSSILPSGECLAFPIAREARSKFLRVVSAGTSVLSNDAVR
jgi:hypothetical protein